MASLGSYLPEPGSAVWRRDRRPQYAADSLTVRHVVIRGTEIKHVPSSYVLYRIDVLTEHSHWYICRRYSEFYDLHKRLVRQYKINRDLLPPKKLSGNFDQQLINTRRQQLEQYLQKLINSDPQVAHSTELLNFLDLPAHDVVQVADYLARQLYSVGDKLLEKGTPVALTINDLYCITKRLRLPMDLQNGSEASTDLGHLYSFIHQVHSLKVIAPPPPLSVTRMAFELAPFRSLSILKIDSVPLSQVSGLVRVQQQLKKLSAQHCLNSLRELLIDSVEEKRAGAETHNRLLDSWRLVATAKFTTNRVVIQPWLGLTQLNISWNKLTQLDDSLQVLSAIKELNISHNLISKMDLQYLCLPTLTYLDMSYNTISTIIPRQLVLENLKFLNLSHNLLSDLSSIISFINIESLDIGDNSVTSCENFRHLSQLKRLTTLTVKDNPIMANNSARLVLLAKFMHKSRIVSIDGLEATIREQAKIRSMTEKFGTDTDQWPVTKRALVPLAQSPLMLPALPITTTTMPSIVPPTVHVSWSVESNQYPVVSDRSSTQSPSPSESSIDHPLFYDAPLPIKNSSLPSSRDDPDGRSDVSNQSLNVSFSQLVFSTPPCTPLSHGGGDSHESKVTPTMISAALEALTQAASISPSDDGHLPEYLSHALHSFINEQLCFTPPSTPFEDNTEEYSAISSSDLISALTATLTAHIDSSNGDSSSSNLPSSPVGSPATQEGLFELAKLGIQPEAILQALSSLQVKLEESDKSDTDLLDTMTPEKIRDLNSDTDGCV